ncbi:hypothetical protein ACFC6L_03145 [Kitasatospora phosalacinea]|uniref:hypothetical protein n=1 Tax=Kitasatospora phosalacinea TaxID=2065 RepID=UPI0035E29AB1
MTPRSRCGGRWCGWRAGRRRGSRCRSPWRITGDARRAVPVLLEAFRPTWPGLRALTVLRRIGRPLPAEHLALLDGWLSPERVGPTEEEVFWTDRLGNRLRTEARLLRARQP